jgi:hypothetical protein
MQGSSSFTATQVPIRSANTTADIHWRLGYTDTAGVSEAGDTSTFRLSHGLTAADETSHSRSASGFHSRLPPPSFLTCQSPMGGILTRDAALFGRGAL